MDDGSCVEESSREGAQARSNLEYTVATFDVGELEGFAHDIPVYEEVLAQLFFRAMS